MSSDNVHIATLRESAVKMAVTQIGQKEDPIGSNKGIMVNEYLKSVGLNPGYAWCMAFVYWCYAKAALAMHIPNPVHHTAAVLDCWTKTAVNIKVLATQAKSNPQSIVTGDQIVFKHSNDTGHTGIVEKVVFEQNVWQIHTIEGNTNSGGSREGYEVERKVRLFNDATLLGFIHYS